MASWKSYANEEVLVFEENFEEFDTAVWQHELTMGGNTNWEFQYYTNNRTNSFVQEGVLVLKPTLTAGTIGNASVLGTYGPFTLDMSGADKANHCTSNQAFGCTRSSNAIAKLMINPIQSARLRTIESFRFKYGRLEVKAKLPRGDWLHPYIMLKPAYNAYGDWPASGEIDLIDSRGNDASYPNLGVNVVTSGLHFGTDWSNDQNPKFRHEVKLPEGDFSDDYHIFGLFWNETNLFTYLDSPDQPMLEMYFDQSSFDQGGFASDNRANPWAGRMSNAPFDQEFFLTIGVACGGVGGYFPDGPGKPWRDHSNVHGSAALDFWLSVDEWYPSWTSNNPTLQIDSIKLWQNPVHIKKAHFASNTSPTQFVYDGSSATSRNLSPSIGLIGFLLLFGASISVVTVLVVRKLVPKSQHNYHIVN